jgi:CRISPR-associated exonuclease Cas4
MEATIPISILNDFIFCPLSIYFHNLYTGEELLYQDLPQIEGKQVHEAIDNKSDSTKRTVLQSIEILFQK